MSASSTDENDVNFWFNKGHTLYEQGRFLESIDCYNKAIQINPHYVDAYNNKGLGFFMLNRYQEALDCYSKALEINPTSKRVWFNKGMSLKQLGRQGEAVDCFDNAIQLDPNLDSVWVYKGICHYSLGQYEVARQSYDKALQTNPNDYVTWYNKGLCLENLNRRQEAKVCHQKSLEINPNNEYAKKRLTELTNPSPTYSIDLEPKRTAKTTIVKKSKTESDLNAFQRRQTMNDALGLIAAVAIFSFIVFTIVSYIWFQELVYEGILLWQIGAILSVVSVVGSILVSYAIKDIRNWQRTSEVRSKLWSRGVSSTTGKWCMSCNRDVPATTKVGDRCPYCGARFGYETKV